MRLMSLDGPQGMAMRQNALVKSCVAEQVRGVAVGGELKIKLIGAPDVPKWLFLGLKVPENYR